MVLFPATIFLVVIYGAVFLLAYHLEQRVRPREAICPG